MVQCSGSLLKTKSKIDFSDTQIIITALNEERGIELTLTELNQKFESVKIIVVDGNSVDKTVEVAKCLGAIIAFQDGIGKGDALAKGIQCLDASTEYVIITDADFTYPIDSLPKMIQILKENQKIGMVCGNRFGGNTNTEAFHGLLSFGNKFIALTHNILNGVALQDPLTGLRVVRADILRTWQIQSKGFDIEVELNHYVERMGYATKEVPIQYRPRIGEKKLKITDGATILKRILMETAYPRVKKYGYNW